MSGRTLKIGTRGSRLALEQAERVKAGIAGPAEIHIVRTSGDRFTDKPLGQNDTVGFFTKEIENELLAGTIDLAVHSLKDLPTVLAEGLAFGAMMVRDDAADLLLVHPDALDESRSIPVIAGGKVGASSLRRQSLLQAHRPDLVPSPIRGNVPTRVEKAQKREYDAIIISRAGVERLALDVGDLRPFEFNPLRWPGAPGQAVIAIEIRADDQEVARRLAQLDHGSTRTRVDAERSLLVAYGGGCHTPFGAYCEAESGSALMVVSAPGRDEVFRVERFEGVDLESSRQQAEAWIRAGCLDRATGEYSEWLCRPARPWC